MRWGRGWITLTNGAQGVKDVSDSTRTPNLEEAIAGVLWKNSAKNFPNIHRISLVSESLYKKVACHQACNFIKKRLQQRCFPVNIANFLRTRIWKKTSEWLLLQPISLIQVKKSNSRTIHFLPLRATSRKALFVLKCFT